MKEQIEIKLLKELIHSKEPLSGSELSFRLGISDKTVLKYLKALRSMLEKSGASLEVKQGNGSYLNIYDKRTFDSFCHKINSSIDLYDPSTREYYILTRLLMSEDYIDVYDLSNDLYISPSLLRQTLKSIDKNILSRYSLSLDHSKNHGYRILGEEANIRRCISKEGKFFTNSEILPNTNNISNTEIEVVNQIVSDALNQFHIAISREGINSIALHILIAINRLETKNTIRLSAPVTQSNLRSSPDFFVANYINKGLQTTLGITLPDNELLYLTMHINGKQRIFGHEQIQVKVSSEAIVFYNQFLRSIYKLTGVDFFEDAEFRTSLLNHIVPFLNRVNNNMQIVKTELPNVRNEYPYAYELAVCGMTQLINKGYTITPAEISYFSLHLALALEKAKTPDVQFNVVIIAEEITSIYRMLSFKITKNFHDIIGQTHFVPLHSINQFNFEDYSLVLNTTKQHLSINKLCVNISSFMNESDIASIKEALETLKSRVELKNIFSPDLFMVLEGTSKEDILNQMIQQINKLYNLPYNFYERIEDREKVISTEYDNRIAIPHPFNTDNLPTFISVAKLNKPIIWNTKPVQLVFLICISNSSATTAYFFDHISKVICDGAQAMKLIDTTDYESFVSCFESI